MPSAQDQRHTALLVAHLATHLGLESDLHTQKWSVRHSILYVFHVEAVPKEAAELARLPRLTLRDPCAYDD